MFCFFRSLTVWPCCQPIILSTFDLLVLKLLMLPQNWFQVWFNWFKCSIFVTVFHNRGKFFFDQCWVTYTSLLHYYLFHLWDIMQCMWPSCREWCTGEKKYYKLCFCQTGGGQAGGELHARAVYWKYLQNLLTSAVFLQTPTSSELSHVNSLLYFCGICLHLCVNCQTS